MRLAAGLLAPKPGGRDYSSLPAFQLDLGDEKTARH